MIITGYWKILEKNSILLTAPRRMGKSSVLTKMASAPPAHVRVIKSDLQALQSPMALVQTVTTQAKRELGINRSIGAWLSGLFQRVPSVETQWLKLSLTEESWSTDLNNFFDRLQAWADQDQSCVVFLWDELTYFLMRLAQRGEPQRAMQILDLLRAIRQDRRHTRLRFVLTGSIGMAEVLDRLRAAGHTFEPLNDVNKQELPVLTPEQGAELARATLRPEHHALVKPLVSRCEGHPFVMQHVAAKLDEQGIWSEEMINQTIEALLTEVQDPLELGAYERRLEEYYPDQHVIMRRALDELVQRKSDVDELAIKLSLERDVVLPVLQRLERDLYLKRVGKKYTFRLELLRRYWAQHRSINIRRR
ncbi:AAA-like domain-containing protein [Myxococcota bacterium]|nr:AAA-like domain-containing protein [Myxococcota bacterium]